MINLYKSAFFYVPCFLCVILSTWGQTVNEDSSLLYDDWPIIVTSNADVGKKYIKVSDIQKVDDLRLEPRLKDKDVPCLFNLYPELGGLYQGSLMMDANGDYSFY